MAKGTQVWCSVQKGKVCAMQAGSGKGGVVCVCSAVGRQGGTGSMVVAVVGKREVCACGVQAGRKGKRVCVKGVQVGR